LIRPGIIAINGTTWTAVVVVWVSIWPGPDVRLHICAIALGITLDVDLSLGLRSND
jgi:hypothetical protein